MPGIRNVVGRPVRGSAFFGREPELRRMWRWLEDNHILLLAPRRVGKTSLMYRLAADAPARDLSALYQSAAEVESDGYIVRDGERWRFRSHLLREYWLRRTL